MKGLMIMETVVIENFGVEKAGVDHKKTPIFTFLKEFAEKDVTPLFVPGHKYGKGLKEFTDYVGEKVLGIDLTSFPESDNLGNPIGIIKESEELLADAFGAEKAFYLVNGTSEGVQVMIRSAVKPGEEIILPRNAHKSTIGGLILSGATPVYVYPEVDTDHGLAAVVTSTTIKEAFAKHPFVKAVLVINPNYYGMVSDLKTIVRTAHREGAAVLVDEAHGAHMRFHERLPITAMEAGADMCACSIHKTAGSMTQSSALFMQGDRICPEVVKTNLNLTRTTSPSYLLMASLEIARKQLSLNGREIMERTLEIADYTREQINQIDGMYAFDREMLNKFGVYDMDPTKLGIYVGALGTTGYAIERELMTRFGIGFEMGDLNNLLGIISIGDSKQSMDRVIEALKTIAKERGVHDTGKIVQLPDMPELIVTPRDAYYAHKQEILLEEAVGEISGELLMAYPPGIPLVCPGERINQDVVDYVRILKEQNATLSGTADPYANYIRVLRT